MIGLWIGVSVLVLCVWLVGKRPVKDRFRAGCFPLFSSEAWLDMIVADGINGVLKEAALKSCLIYPVDWSYDAVDEDSLMHIEYLCRYGKRIGLNLLITERVRSLFSEGCGVEVVFFDLDQTRSIFQLYDTLDFKQPQEFFSRIARRTATLFILNTKWFSDFYRRPHLNPLLEKRRGPHCEIRKPLWFDYTLECDSNLVVPLPPVRDWEHFGSGRLHHLRGDLDSAEAAFRSVSADSPVHPIVMRELASVLIDTVNRSKAIGSDDDGAAVEAARLLHSVLEMDSTDECANRLLGDLYIQQEWWNKAEEALRRAFQWESDDPFLYMSMARLHPSRYRAMGFRNREALLRHALFLNPAYEQARIALGDEFYFRNRPDDAEKMFERLLEIHPRSLDGLLALGKLYLYRNDVLNIVRVYEKVLTIAPDYADAYYNLGVAYFNDGKEDDAIRFFEKAVELAHHAESTYFLGVIYVRRGDRERAVAYFRERIRLRKGRDDPFAEEARKHLYALLHEEEEEM